MEKAVRSKTRGSSLRGGERKVESIQKKRCLVLEGTEELGKKVKDSTTRISFIDGKQNEAEWVRDYSQPRREQ